MDSDLLQENEPVERSARPWCGSSLRKLTFDPVASVVVTDGAIWRNSYTRKRGTRKSPIPGREQAEKFLEEPGIAFWESGW
jgi:hypothetical protein